MDQEINVEDYEHRVRERAYQLWEEAGQPAGEDQQFWFAAQREFEAQHPEHAFPHAGDPHPAGQQHNGGWAGHNS